MNRRTAVGKEKRIPRPKSPCHENGRVDPWQLVWGQPYIDAATLVRAIEHDLQHSPNPDFRTRLLIRDSARAIKSFWGERRFSRWLAESAVRDRVNAILVEDLGKPGFRYIRMRLVASVWLSDLKQVLELLGQRIHGQVEINIAGSIPTLVAGLTARPTEAIDIVDEVPAEIRQQRATLLKLKKRHGLAVGHVQSHYLPANWYERRKFLGDFGGLRVYLVDEYDIFVSKLSSKQVRHKEDLRVLAKILDQEQARQRLFSDGKQFLDDPELKPEIEENWRFIFQEPLFAQGRPKPLGQTKSKSAKDDKKGKPKKT